MPAQADRRVRPSDARVLRRCTCVRRRRRWCRTSSRTRRSSPVRPAAGSDPSPPTADTTDARSTRAVASDRQMSFRPPLFGQHQLGQRDLHLFGVCGQSLGDSGFQPVEELRRPRVGSAACQCGRQRGKDRRPCERGPQRGESGCVVVDLVLRPEPVLRVEHLKMLDRQSLESARRRERRLEVGLPASHDRHTHAVHLVTGQKAIGGQFCDRVEQEGQQRAVGRTRRARRPPW